MKEVRFVCIHLWVNLLKIKSLLNAFWKHKSHCCYIKVATPSLQWLINMSINHLCSFSVWIAQWVFFCLSNKADRSPTVATKSSITLFHLSPLSHKLLTVVPSTHACGTYYSTQSVFVSHSALQLSINQLVFPYGLRSINAREVTHQTPSQCSFLFGFQIPWKDI